MHQIVAPASEPGGRRRRVEQRGVVQQLIDVHQCQHIDTTTLERPCSYAYCSRLLLAPHPRPSIPFLLGTLYPLCATCNRWRTTCNATLIASGSGANRPVATIVVPAWNAWEHTERCLLSLRPTLGARDQVVVVDNGSTDGTREALGAYGWVEVVANDENQGFARGCNQGAARARGGVLVFLNSDTVVPSGWLDELLAPFEMGDVGAVGPRSDNVSGRQKAMAVPDPEEDPRAFADFAARVADEPPGADLRGTAAHRILPRRPHLAVPSSRRLRRAVRDRRIRRRRPVPTVTPEQASAAHCARFVRSPPRSCIVRCQ